MFYASYPITPASELLHELSRHKNFGVITVQAEDEIAAANIALGAAFAGHLGGDRHERSGYGPQGGDPRPGGDHGAPAGGRGRAAGGALDRACPPRPSRPICCWRCSGATASRRCRSWRRRHRRTASTWRSRRPGSRSRYRTPVIVLSDTFLSNSSEPWRIPDAARSPRSIPGSRRANGEDGFKPYARDDRLARPWAVPGTAGLGPPDRRSGA